MRQMTSSKEETLGTVAIEMQGDELGEERYVAGLSLV
jgi:hypothetical protein